jgi:DNA processing protein
VASHVERARHRHRLGGLLALGDAELLSAVGGQRQGALAGALTRFEPDAARTAAAAADLSLLCRHAPAYPRRLLDAADAPAVLHVAGDARALAGGGAPLVAIVGARRATATGMEVAAALGRGLSAAGVPVVSGMALGIDGAAHAGALEAGGPTVAVLAGAAESPYPRSRAGLHRRIRATAGCCVISEMPPGFSPFRWGFPARNRIIAGLADLTIVVEAAERSGSLITAEMAQDLGRVVAAVPGPVTSPMAAGTNSLLRDGAELVRGAQDVLDSLLGAGAPVARSGPDPAQLPEDLRALLGRLGARPSGPAVLTRAADDPDAVVAGLAELELLGHARRVPGGAWVRMAA